MIGATIIASSPHSTSSSSRYIGKYSQHEHGTWGVIKPQLMYNLGFWATNLDQKSLALIKETV